MTRINECLICKAVNPGFRWTDTHGIGQCSQCGSPYQIYHYDAERKLQDLPPVCIVSEIYVPLLQEYWATYKRVIPSGCSFDGGQEMATRSDASAFYEWFNERVEVTK